VLYNKNKWILVAEWYDVDEQEARNRAAEIMIEIFNNRGGQVLEYAAPRERKIGPYGARNVSDWGFYFLFMHMIKDFFDGLVCFCAEIRCEEDVSVDKCISVSVFSIM